MMFTRINARLTGPLASYVGKMTGKKGLYETPSEYVRDLIRRDMRQREGLAERDAILEGYRDFAAGRSFDSTGDFRRDMKILKKKERGGWR